MLTFLSSALLGLPSVLLYVGTAYELNPTLLTPAPEARWGMGMHGDTISPDDLTKSLKVSSIRCLPISRDTDTSQSFWASLIVYYLALGLTKMSILLQYRRVFTTKRFQIAFWILMAVVLTYTGWSKSTFT